MDLLLETTVNELMNKDIPLSSTLLKAKVLASRIGQREFLTWVTNEIGGYRDDFPLPEYRQTFGDIVGNYVNGYNIISNAILPVPTFDEEFDKKIRFIGIYDGIEVLEKLVKNEGDYLQVPFDLPQIKAFENLFSNTSSAAPNFSLTSASIRTPKTILDKIINTVRNQLLDFLLLIETEFGVQVSIDTLKNNVNKIEHFMSTTINNNGDGNFINTGNNVTASINTTINKHNFEQLKKTLSEHNVSDEDIEELKLVINEKSPASEDDYGDGVKGWIKKMMSKAVDGGWKIAIGASGGVLARALGTYFGF